MTGKLTTVLLPGGTMQLSYDSASGQLDGVNGPYGVDLAYAYDGHLLTDTTWSGAVAGNVHRDYDSFFRLAGESVNGEPPVSFGYDDDGLMTQAGDMTLSYDPQNTQLTGTALQTVTDSFSYDSYGEVSHYTASFGSVVLFDVGYVRDDLGRITQKTETVQGQTHVYEYGYDAVGQLTTVTIDSVLARTYVYDANGNRLQLIEGSTVTSGVYNDQDQLLSYGDFTYSYNQRGQLASKTNTVTNEVTLYSYDVLGNLLDVTLPDGTFIEYLVDGDGRRVGKKVNGGLVKQWVYGDDLRIVAELDGGGNVVSRFVWADDLTGALDDPISTTLLRMGLPRDLLPTVGGISSGGLSRAPQYMLRDGNVYRFVNDHLGSARLVVDAVSGSVAESIDYDEWGTVLAGGTGFLPHGFAAGLTDADTGLVRFGGRDYDAQLGRWTAKDPLFFKKRAVNLYLYVGGDPINRFDPAGADAWERAACYIACASGYILCINLGWPPNYCADAVLECYQVCDELEPGPPQPPNNSPGGPRKVPASPCDPLPVGPKF